MSGNDDWGSVPVTSGGWGEPEESNAGQGQQSYDLSNDPNFGSTGGGYDDNFGSGGGNFGGGDDFEGGQENRPSNSVTCRSCNQEGHFSKDCPNRGPPPGPCPFCKSTEHWSNACPEKPEGPLPCLRCGETDHRVRDCPKPPTCRNCNQEGHMAKECPETTCNNCGQSGHMASTCENARKIDRSNVPDVSGEEAWKLIEKAAKERDMDDLKEAIQMYTKAFPDLTYPELEEAFRSQNISVYIIAFKLELSPALTNMDLQGNLEKTYTISFRFSDRPSRPIERENWPSPEDNKERLKDAGIPVPSNNPVCLNCKEKGHTSKRCPQEKGNPNKVEITCINCHEVGHRARDCTAERPNDRPPRECRNCGSTEHIAKECDQPRKPRDDVECHRCHEKPRQERRGGGGGGGGGFGGGDDDHTGGNDDDFGANNTADEHQGGGDDWGTANTGAAADDSWGTSGGNNDSWGSNNNASW